MLTSRRNFLSSAITLGALTSLAPRSLFALTPDHLADAREGAKTTAIKTTKLYDNVFLLQGAGGNMVAQTGPEGTILIDASFSTATPHVLGALKAAGATTPDALINTHWHFDHTDGNGTLHDAGFKIIAHQRTRERLSAPGSVPLFGVTTPAYPAGALPVITFDHSLQTWHNGDSLDLVHFEPAHTDTDIYIHFHKANVIHMGDTWFNNFYPFIDEGSGGNIHGMIKATKHGLTLADDSTKIVPGHGALGDKAGLKKFHDMLSEVRDKVDALKKQGLTEAQTIAAKPTAALDAEWGHGILTPDVFVGIVYRTL